MVHLHAFELPQFIKAIQMSTNNVLLYKENQKKNKHNILHSHH